MSDSFVFDSEGEIILFFSLKLTRSRVHFTAYAGVDTRVLTLVEVDSGSITKVSFTRSSSDNETSMSWNVMILEGSFSTVEEELRSIDIDLVTIFALHTLHSSTTSRCLLRSQPGK